ncbi:MAG: protein kinase domain-containing protein [Planctomycetaceae bacterium]
MHSVSRGESISEAAHTIAEPGAFVAEFLRLLDEGWEPDLEEFVRRVPEPLQEAVFQGIDIALANMPGEEEPPPRPDRIVIRVDEPSAPRIISTADEFARTAAEVAMDPQPEQEPLGEADSVLSLGIEELDGVGAEPALLEELEQLEEAKELAEPGDAEEAAAALPQLPGFILERPLAERALGATFLAFHKTTGSRHVARFLPASLFEGQRGRVLQHAGEGPGAPDAALLAVDSILDAGQHAVLLRPFVEGRSLDEACAGLPLSGKLAHLRAAARAVARLHEGGRTHGNLKPGNVLVTPAGEVLLSDPGLPDALFPASLRGELEFPPALHPFCSPEQAAWRGSSRSGDIFSLGSLLYAILAGKPPFRGASTRELAHALAAAEPAAPSCLDATLPPELDAICLACLSLNPRARPAAAVVEEELARAAAGRPVRLRPALLHDRLRRLTQDHLGAMRVWVKQRQATPVEADRHEALLRGLCEREEHPILEARHVDARSVVAWTAGAFVALGALLSAAAGASGSTPLRLLPCAASLLLLLTGLHARLKREQAAAVPLLFGAAFAGFLGMFSLLPPQGHLAGTPFLWGTEFSAAQCAVAAGGGALLSLFALGLAPARLFAWCAAAFLSFGWLAGIEAMRGSLAHPALPGALLLPPAGLLPLAAFLERRRRLSWAQPCLVVSLGALLLGPPAAALGGLAFHPPRIDTWLRVVDGAYALIAAYALLLAPLAARLLGSHRLSLRQAGGALAVAWPSLLLASLYLNAVATRHPGGVALLVGISILLSSLASRRREEQRGRRALLCAGVTGQLLACHLAVSLGMVAATTLGIGLLAAGLLAAVGAYLPLLKRP